MTMPSPPSSLLLLISPHWTPFGLALVHRLVRSSHSPAAVDGPKLCVLCPYAEGGVPRALFEHMERGTVRIEFGSPGNGRLLAKLVQQHQIRTVFLLLSDDECELRNAEGIATRTRDLLRPLCELLECLRQCDVPPALCTIVANERTMRGTEFLELPTRPGGCRMRSSNVPPKRPLVFLPFMHFCMRTPSVTFHSYRMNAQIVLIEQQLDRVQKREKAAEFVMEIAHKEGGEKAPIYSFNGTDFEGETITAEEGLPLPRVPFARVLLFGTPSALQNALLLSSSSLHALVPGAQLTVATCRPGLDTDEAVEAEIVHRGASHVLFVHGADGETRDAWEAGGPANLRDNVRNNLFRWTKRSPWLLSHISDRFGIVFIEFNEEEGKSRCQSNGKMPTNADELQMSRYAVVRHFGDKLCQMKVNSAAE